MEDRKIAWTSFHIDDFKKSNKEEILEDVDREELDDDEAKTYDRIESSIEVMDSPMGLLIKDDSLNPLRHIEHRICHTNFTIGEREALRVNFIEGVETLNVISRYQMLIGFGRMFDASLIRKNIETALLDMSTYSQQTYKKHCLILDNSE